MHIILHMQIGGTTRRNNMGGLETTLLQRYAAEQRHTAVLVAAMSTRGGERPAPGEPATAHAIARCLRALGVAAEASGGRVVRRDDSELVALFPTPDAAAAAAARMQREAEQMLPGEELGVRGAFHSGPVAQQGHDVFGDTLNLTEELARRARRGQILVSHETASSLASPLREAVRALPLAGRGVAPLAELQWRELPAEQVVPGRAPEVQLTYRYQTLVRRREGDSLTVGRDPDCELCVDMRVASRRHCTIERRGDKLFLRDHSTNGTFITLDGGREACIRAEEIVLHGRGWLSLGVSRLLAEELVQFRCL
jgi:class 3 adenylate cyclase